MTSEQKVKRLYPEAKETRIPGYGWQIQYGEGNLSGYWLWSEDAWDEAWSGIQREARKTADPHRTSSAC